MLASQGLELIEDERGVTLKGSKEGRSFSVFWDPDTDLDEDDYGADNYENEQDRESDEEDLDPEQMEELSDAEEDQTKITSVDVRVTKGGKDLVLHCGVNREGQFLVYRIGSSAESTVVVSDLSEEIQHKVYDYLDELGIGDGTGGFINDYNQYHVHQGEVETLNYVQEFFSK
mmetsp:Transcript_94842/g.142087  ORF Transcript_94842/g.142087 Transcript_94842/m.142087 type:complete len:173 (+) Transcript_94842:318-836(+)|eukprot:CAMPEP_0117038164 /NCGR_PEP_ID=MMETSP0472-20121206/26877_1 /TAXON_ID=693140 ORGANISM="Tiarina fusus, Strain LIS" /NCGR_SAMPLE_ID=MMETSP0472 /ASSEMBLY_ACC=CAM_ASM_000603 /LENGTH=172 /DNA_ID=CAMNT_0004748325 /DNA_START=313 /DNA_END=831 /DNA_ORIENTATION=+